MNKSDKIITAVAVVLTLLFTYLILPTEVGVKLNVDGDVPSDFVYELPTAESHQIETTVPPATVPQPTAPQVTTPAEDNKAESNSDKPESVKEIIDQYTLLVDKFKEEKPAYTKKEYQALPEEYRNFSDVINKFLGIASNYMVTEEQAEELIREKGAAEILTDVPIHNSGKGCALTDYDAVEWAKCEDLGDGTYKITFSLKEEINAEPTPADTLVPPSAHGAVMQPVAFKDIKDGFIVYNEYYAGVLEIDPREFRLLSGYKQDQIIDVHFGKVIRSISGNTKASIVKIDRKMLLDKYVEAEQEKEAQLEKLFEAGSIDEQEKYVRQKIIAERIAIAKGSPKSATAKP